MKSFLNDPKDLVVDALRGLALAHPARLRVHPEGGIVVRADAPLSGKVGVVSGGGAGHEPLHSGFVGRGMLDAACVGEVFTSPVPDQVLGATRAVDGGAGVLHVVKNYTGDVLNFEMAAEYAAEAGIPVETVVVADDVAVEDSVHTAGRRGVGLTVLLEKIVGAAAEEGADLSACAELGRRVAERGRSFGVALTACTVPAVGRPTFDLAADEMEVGVGIHGEAGRSRERLAPATGIAERMVDAVLEDLEDMTGGPGLVLLNGLGGTSQLELHLLFHEVHRLLRARGITIARSLVGSYLTALGMTGASLTVLPLDGELLRCWDAPVDTPVLRW